MSCGNIAFDDNVPLPENNQPNFTDKEWNEIRRHDLIRIGELTKNKDEIQYIYSLAGPQTPGAGGISLPRTFIPFYPKLIHRINQVAFCMRNNHYSDNRGMVSEFGGKRKSKKSKKSRKTRNKRRKTVRRR
jgi:hypothetical protein